jgi:hypothetical protein
VGHFTLTITASVVAWYAAIVATVGAFIQVGNYLRDRVSVIVKYQRGMETINDPLRDGMTFTFLEIVNAGRRPVTITNVTLSYLHGGGAVLTDVMPTRPPFQLTEGQKSNAFVDEAGTRFDEIESFNAHDAVGRTFKVAYASWNRRVYWYFRRKVSRKKKATK